MKFCVTTNYFVEAEGAEQAHAHILAIQGTVMEREEDNTDDSEAHITDTWTKEAIPEPKTPRVAAWHLLDDAIKALQHELSSASAIESLVILPLIGQAAALQSDVAVFNDAKADSQPARNSNQEQVL